MPGFSNGDRSSSVGRAIGMDMSTKVASTNRTAVPRSVPLVPRPSLRTPGPSSLALSLLDWAERLLVLTLYGWLVVRMLGGYLATGDPISLLLLPSEGLVVVFLLMRRRPIQISNHPAEWLVALGATCTPLLVRPGSEVAWLPPAVGATVLLMGMVVQVHAKLTLGRSIGCVPAHRGLRLTGPYRLVRHPMYAGYLLSHLAFVLMHPSLWNLFAYGVAYGLQIPRLLAEERLLSRDPHYRAYQARVRARLLPGLF
jgi:protein-S-isoprenylcysteine O-methyltransferase Ste14